MATISLSPTPVPISAMSSRRGPLTNNPNVANSPLRGASTLAAYAKQKRSYATIQREEPYGQPPPLKKQVLDNGGQRAMRSPTRPVRTQVLVQRGATRPVAKERSSRTASTSRNHDADTEKEQWKKHHRAKFPKMVFYFESIPDDIRARLTKRVTYLGAVCFTLVEKNIFEPRLTPNAASGTFLLNCSHPRCHHPIDPTRKV